MSRVDQVLGGRFLIEREVGRGGVGIVYRAIDQFTSQPVALKVIAIVGVDAGEEARFGREGRVLAGLRHPGIVRVIAFGQLEQGEPFVAMEWLEGEDLAQRQKRAPLNPKDSLDVAAQIAEALSASHEAGIIHRDVKPSNIFIVEPLVAQPGLTAKLVDFGVAAAEDAKITRTGAIIGTPAYMAPEQARGDQTVDARADIYALGATLFEVIAGRAPHVGPTPIAILARLVTTPAPRLTELGLDVPMALDDLMARMLSAAPEERPSSAADVARELREIAETLTSIRPSGMPSDRFEHSPPSVDSSPFGTAGSSMRPGTAGASRLVTSILATNVPKGTPRERILSHLRSRGAEATELGGDAIVAHLGVRKAVGDEAAQAVNMAHRLGSAGARVGIATGRIRIGTNQARPTGEVVDRAAALARDAQKGQVLVDTTTSELLRGRYEFQVRADGSAVVGEASLGVTAAIGGAPFVGREVDLMQLTEAYERSVEDRVSILATLSAQGGLGKTRLLREFLARTSSHATKPRIVVARGDAFTKRRALGLMSDMIRGLVSAADAAAMVDAFTRDVPVWVKSTPATSIDFVRRLVMGERLDEGGGATRDDMWLATTELVCAYAERYPLVFAVEDAQWVDAESLAWLDHMLARSANLRCFCLLTMRPTFWRDQRNRFSGRDHVRMDLKPLAQRSVRSIASAILGPRAAVDEANLMVEAIVSQAAGSPLFAEELARLAALGRDMASAPTIEAAIQVQLDALDDHARDVAARLSVFGFSGWDAGLRALGIESATESLRSLAAAEIVVEQASSRFPGTREFSFKHALTREVAYASLGEEQLKELHERAAEWLAEVADDDAVVARHFELGGKLKLGAHHLERAARHALAANALTQAAEFAERALAFAGDKPTSFARALILDEAWARLDARATERENAIRELQGAVYDTPSEVRAEGARARYEDARGGGPETTARLEEVLQRARSSSLIDEEASCAAALAARCAFAGELSRAEATCTDLLALAVKHGIASAAADAWQTLAVVRQARGEVGSALEARRAAVLAAHQGRLLTREATLMINVGFALTTVGARDEARESIMAGISLAEATGSPGVVRHGQMNLLCWAATFGGEPNLDAQLDTPRRVADDASHGTWVPHDRATLGVLFYRGVELLRARTNIEQARALLRIAAAAYRATKMLDVVPVALGYWSQAELLGGDHVSALAIATEAATLLETGAPSLLNEAPVYLALHDAWVAAGNARSDQSPTHSDERFAELVATGLSHVERRLLGLKGTKYGPHFLKDLRANAQLIALGVHYGVLPPSLQFAVA